MPSFNSIINTDNDPEILLHPTIPKPLHTVNPRSILGAPWWNEERQKSYEKNNYHCHACGIHKNNAKYKQWLEAHEYYDIDYDKREIKLKKIVALCHTCHNYIHSGRLQVLYDAGKISKSKYYDILKHGDSLLKFNDYVKCASYEINETNWDNWCLILNDKKYYSPFETYDDWKEYHRKMNED